MFLLTHLELFTRLTLVPVTMLRTSLRLNWRGRVSRAYGHVGRGRHLLADLRCWHLVSQTLMKPGCLPPLGVERVKHGVIRFNWGVFALFHILYDKLEQQISLLLCCPSFCDDEDSLKIAFGEDLSAKMCWRCFGINSIRMVHVGWAQNKLQRPCSV